MGDDPSLEARRERARNHPLRVKILALNVGRERSLGPKALRRQLPEHPSIAAIEYHLLVIGQAELPL
jgi:hypothetical protein